MAYIELHKNEVLVLDRFQAAAFINETLRIARDDEWEDSPFQEALEWGCSSGTILPLADVVFRQWNIEPVGNGRHAYTVNEIKERDDLFYVVVDNENLCYRNSAFYMFNEYWMKRRIYKLYWTEL